MEKKNDLNLSVGNFDPNMTIIGSKQLLPRQWKVWHIVVYALIALLIAAIPVIIMLLIDPDIKWYISVTVAFAVWLLSLIILMALGRIDAKGFNAFNVYFNKKLKGVEADSFNVDKELDLQDEAVILSDERTAVAKAYEKSMNTKRGTYENDI